MTKAERDPRVDPRHGDVLMNERCAYITVADYRTTSGAKTLKHPRVSFRYDTDFGFPLRCVRIESWREHMKSATVVKKGGEG